MTTEDKKNPTPQKKSSPQISWVFTALIFLGVLAAAILALWQMMRMQQPTPTAAPQATATALPTETQESEIILPTATQAVVSEDILENRAVDSMPLAYVPQGAFMMGSNDPQLNNANPVHSVVLPAFLIDKFEISNSQFAAFLNQTQDYTTNGADWFGDADSGIRLKQVEGMWQPVSGFEQHPVVSISWFGAQAYCEWAGGRLPTEAEWEKAARGADGLIYPWGNQFEECRYANSYGCALDTTEIGSYPEGISPFGAFDMAGNVFEWTADWYGSEYYQNSPAENPTGPDFGTERVMRGGSYYTYETDLQTAFRLYSDPTSMQRYTGFRCVMDIEP
ncbi:MAG: SUMF1/EgtB/PvdO family nonheme iron enzyme [Anaerolineae bacterium]|jgi:formylglycine-generating enzyme required for sulfatase activity|nr:SUMF1/EgtB/PvdO family nonheme iron enzyme [Anaerolineae bacterium]